MKTMKWAGWSGVVLLVASLMWTTGCGGSDGDSGATTTIVVTNETGEVVTVEVPVEPETPPDASQGTPTELQPSTPLEEPTVATQQISLVAPQQVSPQNGQVINTFTEDIRVDFQWTPVNGASGYVFEMDGIQRSLAGNGSTSKQNDLSVGTYSWRVWAVAGSEAGPPSATYTVTVSPFTASP